MSECELCGKKGEVYPTKIEGTTMNLCDACGRHGQKLQPPKNKSYTRTITQQTETILRDDFAQCIKQARQKSAKTIQAFAQQIGEKESVIQHVEQGKLRPSENLAKKLEKTLGIRLYEELGQVETQHSEAAPLTMGDLLRKRTN